MLSSEEAKELIILGRNAILSIFSGKEVHVSKKLKERFSFRRGVFTSILTYPEKELRGCIGIHYPVYPLWQAVVYSSVSAAFKDPRFPPLREREMDKVIWEISVLTEPREIDKSLLPSDIQIGQDGLIVERGSKRGLLLPQVPVRYDWSVEEFLSLTCLKAGLDKDCWKREDVKVYKFQSDIYEEAQPWGEVIRVDMLKCG